MREKIWSDEAKDFPLSHKWPSGIFCGSIVVSDDGFYDTVLAVEIVVDVSLVYARYNLNIDVLVRNATHKHIRPTFCTFL